MPETLSLHCPIRGRLKASARSRDGLRPSEEKLRVDAIRHLIEAGYPPECFLVEAVIKKFGAQGRNSFRADLAVLDTSVDEVQTDDVDDVLEHALLLGEVKRDNRDQAVAESTQVKPLLDFARRIECVGLYWDDIEQRVYWQEVDKGKRRVHDGPLTSLPSYGAKAAAKPLTFSAIAPTDSLIRTFERLEDILHAASIGKAQRYEVMLQLLLAKIFDEHAHSTDEKPLGLQDFEAIGVSPSIALKKTEALLGRAVDYYGAHLPNPVSKTLPVDGDTTRKLMRTLAPVKVTASAHSVIQDFYMKFAKGLYKWDLGQYFTPPTVTDFIVRVLNPSFGEHIKDPACGSADFLTAAFRIGREFDPKYADCVWGADNSREAVQVAVLNMVLNGDGKTNITKEDSLASIASHEGKFDAVVCNPPFGQRITEDRPEVLREYDLGHEWAQAEGEPYQQTDRVLSRQEVGILFVENCIRHVKPGGRVAIILPNGYLGNRSGRYVSLREWMLRNCKVAAVCAFPRFTFKGSGADVSASIVYLEKRKEPIAKSEESSGYAIAFQVVEKVGWSVGDKRARPQYKRDAVDGSYLVDEEGELMLDTDFDEIVEDISRSGAVHDFPWLERTGHDPDSGGWTRPIEEVLADPTLCLDAKRHSRKVVELRAQIEAIPHYELGELVDFLAERRSSKGVPTEVEESAVYRYVQIDDIATGDFGWTELRGWQLPDRARHFAEPGEIYVGSIWGSVRKWFLSPSDCSNLVVTNGCHRMKLKAGKEDALVDLAAALCTDAFATQMRSLARGSDGLAEVCQSDAETVLIPRVEDKAVRAELADLIKRMSEGRARIDSAVSKFLESGSLVTPVPPARPSHVVLV